MGPRTGRNLDSESLVHLTRAARLDLTPDHLGALAPAAQAIYTLIDQLDTVDPGETPPANVFDARRR
ncbi:MAG TPA: hypothetical protein VK053_20940 [Jiangellaceae bacterium]|nr:hypothetical protein [Jiangellaceae bacterium]